jgi:AcrR family transcriptional regulator
MSPRPRKASDDEVFAAAGRVMSRRGPAQITLADVAEEAGLTAGALVQRFGSKRGLLLALMEHFSGGSQQIFDALDASASSPLAAIHAYARCMAQMGETPDALANNLAWLQQDLTDPDFRKHMLIHARTTRRALQRFVQDAVDARELRSDTDTGMLARGIETMVSGSLMAWALYQEGTAAAWVRRDLDAILQPWLTAPAEAASGRDARTARALTPSREPRHKFNPRIK